MADQDFKINIRTVADTTGIQFTSKELSALQTAAAAGNTKAIAALKQLSAATREAQSSIGVGFSGAAVGVGTIVTAVSGAIAKWQQFMDEQDKLMEKTLALREKQYELAQSIIAIQDDLISERRLGVEPLEQSLIRLRQQWTRLKTEQDLVDPATQGEEWKKYQQQLERVEGQIKRITSAIEAEGAAADKTADKKAKAREKEIAEHESFMKGAVGSASVQVQATLQAEAAEIAARRAGEGNRADMFARKAEALKRGMTPAQQEEYQGLTGAGWDKVLDAINDLKRELVGIWR